MVWTFLDFCTGSGTNVIAVWMNGLPLEAQAAIDARLLQMMAMDKWPEKWVSSYRGYPHIIELRVPWNKVQYSHLVAMGLTEGSLHF
jgi:hypothetical protein